MHLILNEEQQFLARTARQFGAQQSPVSRARALRDDQQNGAWPRDLWEEMGKLGWTGVRIPEQYGGSDMGFAELALIAEELGRTLVPEPITSTAAMAAGTLLRVGSDAQKKQWLPAIASGKAVVACALDERRARGRDHHIATRLSGGSLNGTKVHVDDAGRADAFVVSARSEDTDVNATDGVSLVLVPRDAKGVTVTPLHRMDGRDVANVSFEDVVIADDMFLGAAGDASDELRELMDEGRIAYAAEMLGAASEAFSSTIEYIKERVQFGVPIGSFQALQHRAAKLFSELELTRSAVLAAARAIDERSPRRHELASLAKAVAGDTFLHVAHEGVQMHGGVGVTDEYDIGMYLKRARATRYALGDPAYHRSRWATLRGY